ncbi:hypothetical protein GCM10009765_10550 [Fodinicola feengrottensis]|uniref:Uncharacterized protein n=1 Tax=Fodinicola feengrottensis TaxID=435914 RepID=A0ABP4RW67_9ACTN
MPLKPDTDVPPGATSPSLEPACAGVANIAIAMAVARLSSPRAMDFGRLMGGLLTLGKGIHPHY